MSASTGRQSGTARSIGMPAVRLRLLGGFRADSPSGEAVTLRNRKDAALLSYLAMHAGRAITRDKLVALLWGERDEESARHSLRQSLTTLRRLVLASNPEGLTTAGDTVSLASHALEVDVLTFGAKVRSPSIEGLVEAVQLYAGDLLDGFLLREEPFNDWLVAKRQQLRSDLREVCIKLVDDSLAKGLLDQAISYSERLLSHDLLEERILRDLMRALANAGRSLEALFQYTAFSSKLQKELDVEPERETKEIYLQILESRSLPGKRQRQPEVSEPGLVGAFRSLDAFVLYDDEDRFVLCNDKFVELFRPVRELLRPGMRFETILRRLVAKKYFPDATRRRESWIAERLARHRRAENTADVLLTDGRWMFLTQRRTPTGGLVVIFTDVTDRKRRETSLRLAAHRHDALARMLPLGLVETDSQGTILFVNSALERLLDCGDGQAIGRSLLDLAVGRSRRALARVLEKQGGEIPRRLTLEFACGAASKPCLVDWTLVRDDAMRASGLILLVTEQTRGLDARLTPRRHSSMPLARKGGR